MNQLLKRLVELGRRQQGVAQLKESRGLERWVHRPLYDPDGTRLGHVCRVRPDGTGGAWLEVEAEWGILDWLFGMGAGHPRFTFHSHGVEEQGPRLVLKESMLS